MNKVCGERNGSFIITTPIHYYPRHNVLTKNLQGAHFCRLVGTKQTTLFVL